MCAWVVRDQGSQHPAWGRELRFHTGSSAEDGAFAQFPPHTLWLTEFREMLLSSQGSAHMSLPQF